jgi:hypothetical protein
VLGRVPGRVPLQRRLVSPQVPLQFETESMRHNP